jgi:hypothetical protein
LTKVTAQSIANAGPALFLRNTGTSYYSAQWNSALSRWQIVRVQNGLTTILASSAPGTLPLNAGITLSFSAAGSALGLSVNATTVVTANDSALSSGNVGLGSTSSTIRFDDVKVTSR